MSEEDAFGPNGDEPHGELFPIPRHHVRHDHDHPAADPGWVCDECGRHITGPDGFSAQHSGTCSMHPANLVDVNSARTETDSAGWAPQTSDGPAALLTDRQLDTATIATLRCTLDHVRDRMRELVQREVSDTVGTWARQYELDPSVRNINVVVSGLGEHVDIFATPALQDGGDCGDFEDDLLASLRDRLTGFTSTVLETGEAHVRYGHVRVKVH